jgi:sporulation protein YlmC with PRC-barrel domain
MRILAKTTVFVSALALTPALALAQGSNASTPSPNPPAATSPQTAAPATDKQAANDKSSTQAPLYQIKPGDWRASKIMGVNIYDTSNDKVGDVKELIMTKDGKVDAVVVGAGGFIGLGEHDVAIPYAEVTWSEEPVKTNTSTNDRAPASSSGSTTGSSSTTASGSTTPPATTANNNTREDYRPDHGVIKMTKDQLKQLPQVKYSR